jgi:hypothetical protein
MKDTKYLMKMFADWLKLPIYLTNITLNKDNNYVKIAIVITESNSIPQDAIFHN